MNNSRLELLNALYVDVLFRTITDSSREALPVFSKIKTGEFFDFFSESWKDGPDYLRDLYNEEKQNIRGSTIVA